MGQESCLRNEVDVKVGTTTNFDQSSSGQENGLRGTQYKHNEKEGIFDDSELEFLVEHWRSLSADLRQAVMAIVRSVV